MGEIRAEKNQVRTSRVMAFGLSDNGYFISLLLFTSYPLIYMTKCLGMPFPLAVSIASAGKFIDIISGLCMGAILEKVKLPWGKYRSWFLVSPIIATVAACLFYSPLLTTLPDGAKIPVGAILVAMWAFGGNLIRTSYASINSSLTTNPKERTKLMAVGMQCQTVTAFVASLLMMPIVFAIGGTNTINQAGMQGIAIIFSALYCIFCWIFFYNLRDWKDSDHPILARQKSKVWDAILLIFTNLKVFVYCMCAFIVTTGETLLKSLVTYIFIYALMAESQVSTYNWLIVVMAFIGNSSVHILSRKLATRNIWRMGYFGFGVMLVLGFLFKGVPYATLIFIGLAFLCLNISRPPGIPLWGDVSDYIRLEKGKNRMSDIMTVFNLQFKLAGFLAMLGSSVLAMVGFQTDVDPSEAVRSNIITVGLLLPAAFAIVGSVIHMLFFRIDYKKLDAMKEAEKAGAPAQD